MRMPNILEQLQSGPIVYYDAIPDVDREDTDRVGWSKTGKIYCVTKAQS